MPVCTTRKNQQLYNEQMSSTDVPRVNKQINFTDSGSYNSVGFVYDQTQLTVSSLLNLKVEHPYCYRQQKALLRHAQQKACTNKAKSQAKREGASTQSMPAVLKTYTPQALRTHTSN